jgi:hypothetical protein
MARRSSSSKKKAGGLTVDFGHPDAQGGGGRVRVPEDDYRARIKTVKRETSEKSGNPMLVITFVGVEGKLKGKEFRDYFSLMPKALFKLRQLLEALGEEVPDDKLSVAPLLKRAIKNGTEFGVTMTDEEYEGRIRSRPTDYLDLETLEESEDEDDEDDDEEEEKPRRRSRSKSKSKSSKSSSSKKRKKRSDDDDDMADLNLDDL